MPTHSHSQKNSIAISKDSKIKEINESLWRSKVARNLKAHAELDKDGKIVYSMWSEKKNKKISLRLDRLISLLPPEEAKIISEKFSKKSISESKNHEKEEASETIETSKDAIKEIEDQLKDPKLTKIEISNLLRMKRQIETKGLREPDLKEDIFIN
jgi:hypothetical protein